MIAAFAVVLAQTCASMLPARDMELEWLRNGRAYARDVPVEATASSRTYRRTLAGGGRATHTVACTGTGRNAVLTETIASERPARLPVLLAAGDSRVLDGTTIRRISAPANGAPDARWFSASGPLPRVYGVRTGGGIVEMRVPSANGGVDIFRAFVRRPPPPLPQAPTSPMEIPTSALEGQIAVLQAQSERLTHEKRVLEDSLRLLAASERAARSVADMAQARLRAVRDSVPLRMSPVDERLLTMLAVDVFIQRAEFDEALDLLATIAGQLSSFEQLTGLMHPAEARVAEKVESTTKACDRAKRLDRARRCAPASARRAYTVGDVVGLLQGGLDPSSVAARAAYECIAFDPATEVLDIFTALGATPDFHRSIRTSCRGRQP